MEAGITEATKQIWQRWMAERRRRSRSLPVVVGKEGGGIWNRNSHEGGEQQCCSEHREQQKHWSRQGGGSVAQKNQKAQHVRWGKHVTDQLIIRPLPHLTSHQETSSSMQILFVLLCAQRGKALVGSHVSQLRINARRVFFKPFLSSSTLWLLLSIGRFVAARLDWVKAGYH